MLKKLNVNKLIYLWLFLRLYRVEITITIPAKHNIPGNTKVTIQLYLSPDIGIIK
jgi:hypothetical protein